MSKQAELQNLLGELQNRTVSAFTSRRYGEQNILRDEYQEAITAYTNKHTEAELEALREELKHEDLRTISQVITARIDKLKESSNE